MFLLAYGPQPGGPTDKLCPSEEPNEAKPAYPRRDGRQRPRWKDGSHLAVENTHANESRCNEIVLEANHRMGTGLTSGCSAARCGV